MTEFLGWTVATVFVGATIAIHYEIMRLISDVVMPWALRRFHDRRVMMLMMAVLMLGHIVEIWLFAFVFMLMAREPGLGSLSGSADQGLSTFLYFSAVNYTSTGYGDITPHGALRPVSVSEALAGLIMIAWSASFTYLKMEQIWNFRHLGKKKRLK